jgi:tetratricopeptide (TPR) repeat protein
MRTSIALSLLLLAACGTSKQDLAAGDLRKSGTIDFPVTCRPEVKEDFQTAVALLHSFFYEEARKRFLDIAARDPGCAMAWWGVAMTWYHPLWAPPTPDEMAKGREAAEKAKAIGGKTEIERGFIRAIDAFFTAEEKPSAGDPVAQSCHGPRVHGARAVCFRDEMSRLRQKHPGQLEIEAFYALSLLGTAPPTDKTYQNQLAATGILEPLFATHEEHPGVAHYIIHAYDYPTLASRGLAAARRYADIAPWVPHALHMPSHVYTRLGLWSDSIASNLASAEAAREYARRHYGGAATMDELHALDYLVFGYLQTDQVMKAREIVGKVDALRNLGEKNFASAYALGAIPARWVLERREWTAAAALDSPHAEYLGAFPFAQSHLEFARAVGASRSGQADVARRAIAAMEALRERLKDPKFQWWINQVEIQRLAASGWLARAEKNDAEAEARLRQASDLEDASGTHPVTPGQILPAREQLGDLLLELGRPADALAEFERSLAAFPRRFNGHFGAAQAAEKAGKRDLARKHYAALVEMAGSGDGLRPELKIARQALAK